MKDYIARRTLRIARQILRTGETVRACAARFSLSKTTVHKDMRQRLPLLSPSLYEAVSRVLETNKAQRHRRGGEATRARYALLNRQLPKRPECAILKEKTKR